MNGISLHHILMGFLAGAIATVTTHEIIKWILLEAGAFSRTPWSVAPAAVTGIPQIVSSMFWGGVWGALFALVHAWVPGPNLAIKGLLFGIVGPALIGAFIVVPLVTGRSPVFLGGDPAKLGSVLLILAGYGLTVGWLYGLFTSARSTV